jgi:thymidylate kinase
MGREALPKSRLASAFTVALVGPDGAGKSTVTQKLEQMLPLPVKRIYMGVNLESSGLMLPTTRVILAIKRIRGRRPVMVASPEPERATGHPPGWLARITLAIKSGVRMTNWIMEEWFRQVVAWLHRRRGRVVVFDRHFIADYPANGNRLRPLSSRFHLFLLRRFYPKPDLVICLDAPAPVLLARKGEGTLEFLERRRAQYLALGKDVPNFAVVDATGDAEEVARAVVGVIMDFSRRRSTPDASTG